MQTSILMLTKSRLPTSTDQTQPFQMALPTDIVRHTNMSRTEEPDAATVPPISSASAHHDAPPTLLPTVYTLTHATNSNVQSLSTPPISLPSIPRPIPLTQTPPSMPAMSSIPPNTNTPMQYGYGGNVFSTTNFQRNSQTNLMIANPPPSRRSI